MIVIERLPNECSFSVNNPQYSDTLTPYPPLLCYPSPTRAVIHVTFNYITDYTRVTCVTLSSLC